MRPSSRDFSARSSPHVFHAWDTSMRLWRLELVDLQAGGQKLGGFFCVEEGIASATLTNRTLSRGVAKRFLRRYPRICYAVPSMCNSLRMQPLIPTSICEVSMRTACELQAGLQGDGPTRGLLYRVALDHIADEMLIQAVRIEKAVASGAY